MGSGDDGVLVDGDEDVHVVVGGSWVSLVHVHAEQLEKKENRLLNKKI